MDFLEFRENMGIRESQQNSGHLKKSSFSKNSLLVQ
jgi:hypothetical protein